MDTNFIPRLWRRLPWLAAFVLAAFAAPGFTQEEAAAGDPPSRVVNLSHRQGSVVFAPQGEDEWVDLPVNRPLTQGDRVWSDRGARAELQLGSATLHVDGESHIGVSGLDERQAQFIMMQGSVNARVRELAPGENFEIDTPNLAFRAMQPGDYRIDVDAGGKETRVIVGSGTAVVFGEGGQEQHLGAGQQVTFAGRFLAPVQQPAFQQDQFGLWAAERNRAEDQSVAARHVPRGVVGYSQLDAHGTWGQDATHGQIWYPNVTVSDWAPYRYGRWDWIAPWGWTWIDDAPWGFAPFHYGRWAQIGPRWAWVPGRIAARPVYSPALVVFLGGGGTQFSIGGPGVGWYPLGPGEAWWPSYRTSSRYVSWVNPYVNLTHHHRNYGSHMFRHHPRAFTVVREDDFRRGLPVHRHWRQGATVTAGGQIGVAPQRPDRREWRTDRERTFATAPRLQSAPPVTQVSVPSRQWGPNRDRATRTEVQGERPADRRYVQPIQRDQVRPQQQVQQDGAVREQQRQQWQAQQQQRHQQEQASREQQRQQWQAQQQQRHQQEQAQREQQRQQWQGQQQHQRREERAVRQAEPQQVMPQVRHQAPQVQAQQPVPIGRERAEQRQHRTEERGERGEGRRHRGGDDERRGRGRD